MKGTYHMHGATLYDEIVEVPLILSAPGRVEPAVVPSQVSLVDLTPTLLDLVGAPLEGVDGASLLPLLDGTETGDRPAWIVGTDAGRVSQLALREPPWKLTVHVESGEEEAYRLDLDPRELRSVPDEVPAEAARARLRRARGARAARAERRGRRCGRVAARRPRVSLAPAGRRLVYGFSPVRSGPRGIAAGLRGRGGRPRPGRPRVR